MLAMLQRSACLALSAFFNGTVTRRTLGTEHAMSMRRSRKFALAVIVARSRFPELAAGVSSHPGGVEQYLDSSDDDEEDDGLLDDHDEFEDELLQPAFGPPAVVLAGFYVEELPGVRHMLDAAGGNNIALIPCAPGLLVQPLAAVLQQPEPAWEQPVPPSWVDGGGWGCQLRTVIFSGLGPQAQGVILQLLEESKMGEVIAAAAAADDAGKRLGDVLAAAVAAHRNRAKGFRFSDELPSLEQILGERGGKQQAADVLPSLEQISGEQGAAQQAADESGASDRRGGEGAGAPLDTPLDDDFLDVIDKLAAGQAVPALAAAPCQPLVEEQPESGGRDAVPPPPVPPPQESVRARPDAPDGGRVGPGSRLAASERPPGQHGAGSDERTGEEVPQSGRGATLPELDQFVLNKHQLKLMAEEAGLDYAVLLQGLQEKGIELQG